MRADIFWALISKLKPSFVVGHRIFVSEIHLKHIYTYIYISTLSIIVHHCLQIIPDIVSISYILNVQF